MKSKIRYRLEDDFAHKVAKTALPPDETMFLNRQETALLLGCSVMTVKRMDWEGRLKGIQLRPGPTSPYLYRKADVYKLAGLTLPPT